MVITVFATSVTASRETKYKQCESMRILDSKGIKYETVDISLDNCLREQMREKAGDPKALPPQIFNGEHYCGSYEELAAAAEEGNITQFLKLED